MSVVTILSSLQTQFQAALPDVQHVVGQDYDPAKDYNALGWVSESEPGVTESRSPGDAGLSRDQTSYDVHCLLGVARGAKLTQLEVIQTAYDYLDTLRSALRTNSQPGGAARAFITERDGLFLRNEAARMVLVRYVVNVKVWSL